MKQNLLNTKKIEPKCEYCAIGRTSADERTVLCVENGVMMPDSACRHFKYDVLKRRPAKPARLPEYSAEEFAAE